jgi:hypothetical protein
MYHTCGRGILEQISWLSYRLTVISLGVYEQEPSTLLDRKNFRVRYSFAFEL